MLGTEFFRSFCDGRNYFLALFKVKCPDFYRLTAAYGLLGLQKFQILRKIARNEKIA